MARGTGNGKTPQFVVEVMRELMSKSSLNAIFKATGIGVSALARYRDGIGEPTQHTLQRLSDFTGKTFTIEIKPSA